MTDWDLALELKRLSRNVMFSLRSQFVPRSKHTLCYKNQQVNAVYGYNGWLFSNPHRTHKCTLWTECGLFEC